MAGALGPRLAPAHPPLGADSPVGPPRLLLHLARIPGRPQVSNLAEYGNTSAASIPLVLDEAVRGGRIKDGDVLALAGFGAGLTWAGAIVRWGPGNGK